MKALIEYLERKITGCDELGGMGKEKWAFQQCLKEVRGMDPGEVIEHIEAAIAHLRNIDSFDVQKISQIQR